MGEDIAPRAHRKAADPAPWNTTNRDGINSAPIFQPTWMGTGNGLILLTRRPS